MPERTAGPAGAAARHRLSGPPRSTWHTRQVPILLLGLLLPLALLGLVLAMERVEDGLRDEPRKKRTARRTDT